MIYAEKFIQVSWLHTYFFQEPNISNNKLQVFQKQSAKFAFVINRGVAHNLTAFVLLHKNGIHPSPLVISLLVMHLRYSRPCHLKYGRPFPTLHMKF